MFGCHRLRTHQDLDAVLIVLKFALSSVELHPPAATETFEEARKLLIYAANELVQPGPPALLGFGNSEQKSYVRQRFL